MEITINNESRFTIYDLDTKETIIKRIASVLNTLPQYLYFNEEGEIQSKDDIRNNINVLDILSLAKNRDINFDILYNEIKHMLDIISIKDIINIFIVFNRELESLQKQEIGDEFIPLMLDRIKEQLKEIMGDDIKKINIEKIWKERKDIRKNIKVKVDKNRESVLNIIKLNEEFQFSENIEHSSFELEKISVVITFRNTPDNLSEFFNEINSSQYFPFAVHNNFYKIYKGFIPTQEWIIDSDEYIIIKIVNNIDIEKIGYDDYVDLIIFNDNGVIKANTEININKKTISFDEYIDRLFNIFPTINPELEIEEHNISGVFYFLNAKINNYIFSDLIMNNPLFSRFFAIDESKKATKDKNSLYVHFNHYDIGNIKFTITNINYIENSVEKQCIRIKINKSKNQDVLNSFKDILGRFIFMYQNKYDEIFRYYKNYIPKFNIYKKGRVIKQKSKTRYFKDIDPLVFLKSYTRTCTNKPTIIENDEVQNAIKDGREVMIFPKNDMITKRRNYICNYEEHKYPGLTKQRGNKNFEYVPCCFINNQKQVPTSNYNKYYKDDEEIIETKHTAQQEIIVTNKFVKYNTFGILPINIEKVFDTQININYKFLRKGVLSDKNSFLNCVLYCVNEDIRKETDQEQIEIFMKRERLKISEMINLLPLCKQELFDLNINKISLELKEDNYFNPLFFLSLLEYRYNCNIYLFNRDTIDKDGNMILPNHTQAFYKTKNNNPNIFIYQHTGSEKDVSTFPRCEIIVKWLITEEHNFKYIFDNDDTETKIIKQFYNKIRESYSGNKYIEESSIINTDLLKEQFIDSYGKTRLLRFKYKNNFIDMLTSPLPPSPVKINIQFKLTQAEINTALVFCNDKNINIVGQILNDNQQIIALIGKLGNIDISIPIIPSKKLKIMSMRDNIDLFTNNNSQLQIYIHNKKLARYITEYILWMYSNYLKNNNIFVIDDLNTVYTFIENHIIVDQDFSYGYIDKEFKFNNENLMIGNKIVLKSNEVLKRLVYLLKLQIVRNKNAILSYYKNKNIQNYFLDSTDFKYFSSQLILKNSNSVLELINQVSSNYILRNKIEHNNINPYFFKNKLVDQNVYLVQNTDSIQKAIHISKTWNEKGYNISYNSTGYYDKIYFTLYNYINEQNIFKHYINRGFRPKQEIQIIIYKFNNITYFASLLKI